MTALILGLLIFLGLHSVRIVAEPWRQRTIARMGEGAWKGVYSLLSGLGLALIVWGYAQARLTPLPLWTAPVWARHLAGPLTLVAFVLLAAAYVPGNGIKARLHHPMLLAVKVWALAHLLANDTLADLLLFGGFLLWAVLDFRTARRRDAATGTVYPPGRLSRTLLTTAVGVAAWAVFAFWAHGAWLGVRPFGV
ncbi:MAG: NnrU family protein [Proteobacteria bacterium]|nr:NnrU family protein [Pseudomonadota bacterium]